jgi:methionyl-tRNA synthetase
MDLARNGNKYLQETEPWKLIKTDEESVRYILASSLEYCQSLAKVMAPFLPNTAKNILHQLNCFNDSELTNGHSLNEASLLFRPIEDSDIEKQLAKLEASKMMNTPATTSAIEPAKAEITFDDFAKTDIRVGTILEAERVPKTDKLLKLKIDTGIDQRTVVSGIAEYHQPEDIIGKQVCILINLAPRKMKGIESQGMILMAKDTNGQLVFVSPEVLTSNGSGVA